MKKLFEIDNSEKQRILEMHQNATKKNYLSEQNTAKKTQPNPNLYEPSVVGLSQEQLNYIIDNQQRQNTFVFPNNDKLYLTSKYDPENPEGIRVLIYKLMGFNDTGIPVGIGVINVGSFNTGTIRYYKIDKGSFDKSNLFDVDTVRMSNYTPQEALNSFVTNQVESGGSKADPQVFNEYVMSVVGANSTIKEYASKMFNKTVMPKSGVNLQLTQQIKQLVAAQPTQTTPQ
jgi:hypothetical protein